jgi:DNA-binding transcriptional LysR family regulator
MRIDFLGIEAFVSIADRGSFHLAAAHLNLSQTALSHRMRKLEDDLGVKLFTRTTRRLALTPAGLELLPKARRMLDDMASSYRQLQQQGRRNETRLALGCLPTIANHYLPRVLGALARQHPDLAIQVFDNSASEIAELVQKGEAEFGITFVSANPWDLDIKPLIKEPYVVLCPCDHPLAQQEAVAWSELEGFPLVRISRQTGNRVIIDEALGSRREAMTWRYEVQHVATAISMVQAGIGLTIVPRLAVDAMAVPGLVARPMRNPAVARTLGIIMKRGLPLSDAGQALVQLLERTLSGDA